MITQGLTTSFKQQLFTAIHDFTPSTGDAFKIALYLPTATIGEDTTVYTATGEITGTNYTAGGIALTTIAPTSTGTTAYVSFQPATYTNLTAINIAGALIYNSTEGNKTVCVLNFGSSKISTASSFVITFPTASSTTAIIRLP
jgi:hypothetical protein